MVFLPEINSAIGNITKSKASIIAWFSNPLSLNSIPADFAKSICIAPNAENDAQDIVAQIIFGGIGAKGKLAESINENFQKGLGIETVGGIRFKYTLPEELGINSIWLSAKIDSVCTRAIQEHAFPGCVVLAAKNGKVFYHKAYGNQTYEQNQPVQMSDIFDFASITKISATLPCYMALYDQNKLKLDDKLSKYLKFLRKSNKKEITFRLVLSHYAQLQAWLPLWKDAIKKSNVFSTDSSRKYSCKVSNHLFITKKYKKQIYKTIAESPLTEKKAYLYSDLSFILAPAVIEKITHQAFDDYLYKTIYQPLGAYSLTFNPYKKYPITRIVPTEYDSLFRKELIHGTVHDEGAGMLNGISGHAGLFGTANDLAKLMQMYIQKGQYGNHYFFSRQTVNEFIRCQYCEQGNRRALGFDKPLLEHKEQGTPSIDASAESFGHTGFTGTFTWADPQNGLLIVVLSNRVYPTRKNNKLSELNVRPTLHQILYDALKSKK